MCKLQMKDHSVIIIITRDGDIAQVVAVMAIFTAA